MGVPFQSRVSHFSPGLPFQSISVLKERQAIQQQVAEINAAKRVWVATKDGPEKAKLAEKFFSVSNCLDPKWYHLTIRKGVASSQ